MSLNLFCLVCQFSTHVRLSSNKMRTCMCLLSQCLLVPAKQDYMYICCTCNKFFPYSELLLIMSSFPAVDCDDPDDRDLAEFSYKAPIIKYNTTKFGSVALYTCHEGYRLPQGSNGQRTCQANGNWSGGPPECEGLWQQCYS